MGVATPPLRVLSFTAACASESEPPAPAVTPKASKPKRRISAAGMKKIIAATKKRWAKVRAEQAAKAKRAVTKKSVAKKTAVKKVVAKKAVVRKVPGKKTAKKTAPAAAQAVATEGAAQ